MFDRTFRKIAIVLLVVVIAMWALVAWLASAQAAPTTMTGAAANNRLSRESQLEATSVYTIVDDTGAGGFYASLNMVNGNPAIAYLNPNTVHLKYARAGDVNGSTWGMSLTVDSAQGSGQFASLAVVNGGPAIAYYTGFSKTLNYVRASNTIGTAWAAPHTVDNAGDVGRYASLAVVNGNPAIAYFDNSTLNNGHLKYVRAADANGTTWATPITIDSAGDTGWYSSLQVVNGKPAIAYFDLNNGGHLNYVRANDADGASWGITHTVDSHVIPTLSSRLLVIVNGHPAIAYGDASSSVNGHLKYVRATDANGDSWGAPVLVDITGNVGYFPSLAVINSIPAIAYSDNTSHDLKYVEALEGSGTTWGAPLIVDSGQFDSYSSLADVNGLPGIAYEDYSGIGSLRFTIPVATRFRIYLPIVIK